MTLGFEMSFPSGVVALLDCSFECPDRNRIELVGTKGAIELPGGVLPGEDADLIVRTNSGVETISIPSADQYGLQVKTFCASVAAGKLLDPAENGLANMQALSSVKQAFAKLG
jgi:predicted dehydrogenase